MGPFKNTYKQYLSIYSLYDYDTHDSDDINFDPKTKATSWLG